jgi:hypothetical protein
MLVTTELLESIDSFLLTVIHSGVKLQSGFLLIQEARQLDAQIIELLRNQDNEKTI